MLADWEIDDKIYEVLGELAITRVTKFYPSFIAKATHLPVNVVFNRLLAIANSGRIILKWEIRCPNCSREVAYCDSKDDKPPEDIECMCGEEFSPELDDMFPVFELDKKYRESVRERNNSIDNNDSKKKILQLA